MQRLCGLRRRIVATLDSPLMVMNVLHLQITGACIIARIKDMNLAVGATQKSDHGNFPSVLPMRADGVDQAVLFRQQTVRITSPFRPVAVPSNATNVRTCKVGLQQRASVRLYFSEKGFSFFPAIHFITHLLVDYSNTKVSYSYSPSLVPLDTYTEQRNGLFAASVSN
jgi:hypothetical protein